MIQGNNYVMFSLALSKNIVSCHSGHCLEMPPVRDLVVTEFELSTCAFIIEAPLEPISQTQYMPQKYLTQMVSHDTPEKGK